MDRELLKLLDNIGRRILAALEENARLSMAQLGRRVGLSAPAVAERVKRLEEAGIIRGYHADIDPAVMGRSVLAFIQLSTEARHYPAVKALATRQPEIIACHHISGEASFVLKVRVAEVKDLESVVALFSPHGQTRTSIVLSTSVEKRGTI